jgi:hypothetical protein
MGIQPRVSNDTPSFDALTIVPGNRSLQSFGNFILRQLWTSPSFSTCERLPLTTRDELLFVKTHRSRGTNFE